MKVIAIVCVVSTACVDDVDQRWDLDHDHDHVAVPVTAFQRANITGVVMHDHDVYVSVEGDRVAGELSVVIRDGGVAWRVWPIRGER